MQKRTYTKDETVRCLRNAMRAAQLNDWERAITLVDMARVGLAERRNGGRNKWGQRV